MPNPYEYLVNQPEMVLWYVAVALFLIMWLFVSYRKMFSWLSSISASSGRWEYFLLPPDDLTKEIAAVLLVTAANLFLLGLILYVLV